MVIFIYIFFFFTCVDFEDFIRDMFDEGVGQTRTQEVNKGQEGRPAVSLTPGKVFFLVNSNNLLLGYPIHNST